ncbi:hypothetical protein IGI04_001494 [Brassica rapa subsp. trilocularis]|uniref:FK506-binding protein n=2 Tax=Brassica campestris TaxID=3711 RepID=M4DBM7_BRACM|nr:peptidyl-prolyl cis-trans isomerase FKBP53 [Brassica rapa]KAG5413927.1 hypothetical protein IGI04_001494 [Brassica rapa subsp. trilocularis]
MGFWGLEVKPGKPQAFHPKNEQGKLHLTQATLGSGSGKEKSVIQCSIAGNTPIYLCSLLPNKTECCPLNLEFEDDDETVEFSVAGDRSIHLSGFLEEYDDGEEYEQDEDDSDGMEIAEMGSEESSDYDSEDDEDEDEMDEDQMDKFEDFLDRNLEMYRQSSVPNSGVVIEEIEEDEEKPVEDKKTKRAKKKSQATKDENAGKQIIVKESAHASDLESEDDDGFPIPKENKSSEKMSSDADQQGSNKKRKAKASEQDGVQESENKNKKKKNQKEKKKGESASNEKVETVSVLKKKETTQTSSNQKAQNETKNNAMSQSSKTPDKSAEKKNKQKNTSEKAAVENSKASQEQTYPNGLVVEELKLGKPNGKQATPGKQVSVRYIGKLQKNGKIFDSNIGKAPFKFKIGRGEVIKGWDVGVNGMRVGEKRKLTIPPSMGYGSRGAGGQIPPNAWLSFEVELIDVK